MKIECGKLCGFCSGVSYTVNKTKELLESNSENIYSLGEIVHNERVIEELKNNGLVIVDNINKVPDNLTVIFRAHGEEENTYEKAKAKNLNVIDLTCGKIKIIRYEISKFKNSAFIIIIGKKKHPETIGNLSYAGDNSCVIENIEDIEEAYQQYKKSNLDKVYVVSQTTFSSSKFDKILNGLNDIFHTKLIVNKSICNVTEERQKETFDLSKKVNKMIIIGGKHSSNTKELENISRLNCKNSVLIQNYKDLDNIDFKEEDIIGIVTGASTPKEYATEVIDYLNKKRIL